jgi:hypothetical protein
VVASKGVTVNHDGTGVAGAPLSTSNAKSMAVLVTEVTVMACVGGFGPLANALNARLVPESCSAGFCATPSRARARIPAAKAKRRTRVPYVIDKLIGP